MLLPSDLAMIRVLEQFEIATALLIDRLSYRNYKITSRRLKKLYEDKVVYRTRDIGTKGYIYGLKPFTKCPREVRQIRHKGKRNELYLRMIEDERINIKAAYREQLFKGTRADLIVECTIAGKEINYIVEIETGSKKADLDKYNQFYYTSEWKKFFDSKPIVIWVMDQKPLRNVMYYPYKWIKFNLENYEELLGP